MKNVIFLKLYHIEKCFSWQNLNDKHKILENFDVMWKNGQLADFFVFRKRLKKGDHCDIAFPQSKSFSFVFCRFEIYTINLWVCKLFETVVTHSWEGVLVKNAFYSKFCVKNDLVKILYCCLQALKQNVMIYFDTILPHNLFFCQVDYEKISEKNGFFL